MKPTPCGCRTVWTRQLSVCRRRRYLPSVSVDAPVIEAAAVFTRKQQASTGHRGHTTVNTRLLQASAGFHRPASPPVYGSSPETRRVQPLSLPAPFPALVTADWGVCGCEGKRRCCHGDEGALGRSAGTSQARRLR